MGDVRRDAFEASIRNLLPILSLDELRVIDRVVSRVAAGRDVYGPLVLARDGRDLRAEAADELTDALWYLCAHEVARDDARLERLRCEAADEIHGTTTRRNLVEAGLAELANAEPITAP